jgi:hypothetical protein
MYFHPSRLFSPITSLIIAQAVSTLSLLSPMSRLPFGIPFLYQRLSSSTPLTALISTRSPQTSLSTLHLDGRYDWLLTSRTALLAWSGHTLILKPRINTRLSLQHWGNTLLSGRGIVALVGRGQIYQVTLREGEEYVVHPSHVLGYTQNAYPPQPYRFRNTTLKLQVPNLAGYLPEMRFFKEMRKAQLWKFLAETLFRVRTWTRRSIFGDRLFLQFKGPTTILLQSRGASLRDSLSSTEVNEIADAPAGAVQAALSGETVAKESEKGAVKATEGEIPASARDPVDTVVQKPAAASWAIVSRGGKVDFKKQDTTP